MSDSAGPVSRYQDAIPDALLVIPFGKVVRMVKKFGVEMTAHATTHPMTISNHITFSIAHRFN